MAHPRHEFLGIRARIGCELVTGMAQVVNVNLRQPTGQPADRERSGRRRARDASRRAGIVSGHGVTTGTIPVAPGGRQSRGAALASPPPLRGGATGRQPPGLPPRAGSRVVPTATNARSGRARTANVLDHQGEAGQSARSPGEDQEQTLAARQRVRGTSPLTLRPTMDVAQNLSRAPTASLRDRLRRHLTEPVRRAARMPSPRCSLASWTNSVMCAWSRMMGTRPSTLKGGRPQSGGSLSCSQLDRQDLKATRRE